ncbi:MAG: hypothetical protein AB1758_26790, partial [Candidatus Eremiobacterota bacterium]
MSYTARDVLAELDLAVDRYEFPALENANVTTASVRLSAWRDPARWALVIEVLGDHAAAGPGSIYTAVHGFGNCLKKTDPVSFIFSADVGPTLDVRTGALRPDADWMDIRGRRVPIDVTPEALKKKGIHRPPDTFALLLSLLPERREELLATPEELAETVPDDLPLLLRLDEWNHPRVGDFPGQNETFQMLA